MPSEDEQLYRKCTPYSLLCDRAKSEPVKREARVPEEHLHDWNLLNDQTSKILYNHALGGDEDAAKLLFQYAAHSTKLLRNLAFQNPSVLLPTSEYQIQWPMPCGKKKYLKEENEKVMKAINLGAKSKLTGNFNLKSPFTQTALQLLSWLQQNQETLGLPLLTKATRKQWFEAGWKRHLFETNDHPEEYDFLRKSVEKHAHKASARKQEKRNENTVMRELIKDRVKQSFESLTAKAQVN